ncbi:MAG: hypothetical protein Q8Q02_16150 [Nocardioides sp.]|nr:hypothetical protein [Nocardioides sp.]
MNPAARPTTGLELDRRRLGTIAALGAGALAVSACTARRAEEADPVVVDDDPDLALVAEVSAVVGDRARLLEETVARHAGLGPRLAALAGAHRAHLAVLADVAPPAASPPPPAPPNAPPPAPTPLPARRRGALAGVVAAESAAADELTRLAFRARSGPLARLVAGMAASTAMHVAHLAAPLPEEVTAP